METRDVYVCDYSKLSEEFVFETGQCFSVPLPVKAEAYHQSTTIAMVNCA